MIYLAQFVAYIEVVEMYIPENESDEQYAERIHQYGKINGKLIATIGGSSYRNPIIEYYCVGIIELNGHIIILNFW